MQPGKVWYKRVGLTLLWIATVVTATAGVAYPAAVLWLEKNTFLVQVVDSQGRPVAGAQVMPVAAIFN